jgi:hypothetical protein
VKYHHPVFVLKFPAVLHTIMKTHLAISSDVGGYRLRHVSRTDRFLFFSFKTFVIVAVPPMLWIPHQLVGAPLAYSVTLECFTEAHPSSLNYWTREDGQMIHETRKYHTENTFGDPSYKIHMKLTINNIQQSDYGTYKCVAKNPRGETDGTIRLYSKCLFLMS